MKKEEKKHPIQIFEPTVAGLVDEKIFVEITPLDDWNNWLYSITLEDAMSPFFVAYAPDEIFGTYRDALKHAIQYLEDKEIIIVVELPF